MFYDDNDYPLDRDHEGNIWKLRSDADHLTRSKVMYHPAVVAKKNEDIRMCVEAQTSKARKTYEDAKCLFEVNKDVEVVLMNEIQSKLTEAGCNSAPSLALCTLEMFNKLNVSQ